ncbi:hypothetical protein DNTS_025238, partial [Danionella cerebrum]
MLSKLLWIDDLELMCTCTSHELQSAMVFDTKCRAQCAHQGLCAFHTAQVFPSSHQKAVCKSHYPICEPDLDKTAHDRSSSIFCHGMIQEWSKKRVKTERADPVNDAVLNGSGVVIQLALSFCGRRAEEKPTRLTWIGRRDTRASSNSGCADECDSLTGDQLRAGSIRTLKL